MLSCLVNAQTPERYHISVSFGDQIYNTTPFYLSGSINHNRNMESGIYLGFISDSDTYNDYYDMSNYREVSYESTAWLMGAQTRKYLKATKGCFNPYVAGKLGVYFDNYRHSEYGNSKLAYIDWALSAGVKLKVYKGFSVFGEGGFGSEEPAVRDVSYIESWPPHFRYSIGLTYSFN